MAYDKITLIALNSSQIIEVRHISMAKLLEAEGIIIKVKIKRGLQMEINIVFDDGMGEEPPTAQNGSIYQSKCSLYVCVYQNRVSHCKWILYKNKHV